MDLEDGTKKSEQRIPNFSGQAVKSKKFTKNDKHIDGF